jgi:hypothetical protein
LFVIKQEIEIRRRDETRNWLKIDNNNEINNEKNQINGKSRMLNEKEEEERIELEKRNLNFGPF